MTYQQWKEEGQPKEAPTVSEKIGESPLAEAGVEVEVVAEAEPEVEVEAEAVAEAEAVVEDEPETVVKPKTRRKAAPKGKAKKKTKRKPKEEPEPAAEAEPVSEAGVEAEAEVEAEPAPVEITVEELQSAFQADRDLAEIRFEDKILKITGVVGRVAVNDIADSPCIILTGAEKTAQRNVLCVFDKKYAPEIKNLEPGQSVTVQGKYDSCTINILVTDCVLVS